MDTTPSESSAAPSAPATPPPPPPLIQPSSPAKPPHKGRGWMIFAIVLIVLLGFSVLMNVGQLFDSLLRLQSPHTRSAGPQLHEVVLEYNRADSKIAVVPVEGLISSLQDRAGFSMVEVIKAQLKRAAADEDVTAVLLKVDSPGGEVLASEQSLRGQCPCT